MRSSAPVHLVCYCDDCQGYAGWLEARRSEHGGSVTALDAQGGSRTCQVFGADVQVIAGGDQLHATVLDPALVPARRPQQMLRLHSACCATAMFSASWRELPTVGFYAAAVVAPAEGGAEARGVAPDPSTGCWGEDPLLGAPQYRINTRWARAVPGRPPPRGAAGFPLGFLLRFAVRNFLLYRDRRAPYPWALPPPGQAEVRREQR